MKVFFFFHGRNTSLRKDQNIWKYSHIIDPDITLPFSRIVGAAATLLSSFQKTKTLSFSSALFPVNYYYAIPLIPFSSSSSSTSRRDSPAYRFVAPCLIENSRRYFDSCCRFETPATFSWSYRSSWSVSPTRRWPRRAFCLWAGAPSWCWTSWRRSRWTSRWDNRADSGQLRCRRSPGQGHWYRRPYTWPYRLISGRLRRRPRSPPSRRSCPASRYTAHCCPAATAISRTGSPSDSPPCRRSVC